MGACTAALACFAPHASGQAARGNTALRLSREIENSKLIDISSDSDKLCFYFSKHNISRITSGFILQLHRFRLNGNKVSSDKE